MYSLIATAKMNGVDPQAWLADVLAYPAHRLEELLPWNGDTDRSPQRQHNHSRQMYRLSGRRHLAALRIAERHHPIALLVGVWHDQASRRPNQRKRFLRSDSRTDQCASCN
jgi:hypothetical protein